jgi:hypothetical protein
MEHKWKPTTYGTPAPPKSSSLDNGRLSLHTHQKHIVEDLSLVPRIEMTKFVYVVFHSHVHSKQYWQDLCM